ncbi:MAG: AAA family ATPase, partial [Thermofilaceae archaeon]
MPTVFIDKEKLSSRYVPPKLPHRGQQLRILENIVIDVIGGMAASRVALLTGPVGTGKTSSVILLHSSLCDRCSEHIFAYMNMRFCGETPFTFFSSFYEKVTNLPASRSLGAGEILREILKALEKRGKPTLLVLDEAEHHARSSLRTVIYTLTRLHEVEQSLSIAVLFISRNLEWLKLLDPAERSTLGNLVIHYSPYSTEQLYDILSYRASEAFKVGAVNDETLKWLAEYTHLYMCSDVRRALDTL